MPSDRHGGPHRGGVATSTTAILALVFAFVFAPFRIVFGITGRAADRRYR